MAAGLDAAETLAMIAIALTVGELLAGALCPLALGDKFKPTTALAVAVAFALLFLVSSIYPGPLSLVCWCGIGVAAGMLQYFGTTFAVIDDAPEQASQLRLSLSLAVSGAIIATSAIWVETGYDALKYGITGLLLLSTLAVWFIVKPMQADASDRQSANPDRAEASAPSPYAAFLSVLLFFAVFLPFVSILPAMIDHQSADKTLLQMGLGKLIAAVVLYRLSRMMKTAETLRSAILSAGCLGAASGLVVIAPSVLVFAVLEIGINAFVAMLLGRHGRLMSLRQKTWMFFMIQLGSLAGFAALGLLPSDQTFIWWPLAIIGPVGLALLFPGLVGRPRKIDHF
ncbi:hypothetical protein [Gymnodinialimonas sp.]